MQFKTYVVGILIMLATQLFAQHTEQIELLDQNTFMPIVGATFEYGKQSGISDEKGTILFNLEENVSMRLSHVSYGSWTLSSTELKSILKKGKYYRKDHSVNLYPVTVIAVQDNQSPQDKLSLSHLDHMSHDGGSVLNQSVGFNSIRKSGNYGFDPVFRGFKYDQLNIVMNGAQSATAACPNRMDPPTSQMAPNMMNRIEILKGPYALRYGSGFGATINFIPTNLNFSNEGDVYGRVSSAFETNGSTFRNEGQVGFSGESHDISFFGSWSQGHDYKTGNGEKMPADFRRASFGTSVGLKLTPDQQLRLSAIYNRARDTDFAALPMDLRDDDTWMFNARHDIHFNDAGLENWNTTLYASFVDHLMDNLLKSLDPRMMNASTNAKTYNYGGRTEGVWKLNNATLFTGLDYRTEGAAGTRTREFLMGPMAGNTAEDNAWQEAQVVKSGVFGEYQLSMGEYRFAISGRMELNQASVKDASAEFETSYPSPDVTQINPSISLGATRRFENNLTLGIWVGRAQRSGSISERYINYFPIGQDPYEIVGNPDLKPEVNNQTDLTIGWANSKMAVNIDGFFSYLQDYISSEINPDLNPRIPSSPGVRNMINIEDAFKTGFELSYSQSLASSLSHRLSAAYTYARDLERNEPLPEIPPLDLRYGLQGKFLADRLESSLQIRHVFRQDRISEEYGETKTPAFTTTDFQMGYQVGKFVKVNVAVNNLFDVTYYEHLNRSVRGTTNNIYARGRNFILSMNLKF